MNLKVRATLFLVCGLLMTILSGGAIARSAGFGSDAWLLSLFGLGILLLSQVSVLRVEQQLRELQQRTTNVR